MTDEVDLGPVTQADTKVYSLTFSDGEGNTYDISGWTMYFTVRSDYGSPSLISKDVTSHTDPTAGETELKLTPTDTNISPGTYIYDLQVKNNNGDIFTVSEGHFGISEQVTQRT